jgi:hypothetical protein
VELLYKDGCRTEGKILSSRDHPKKKKKVREFLQESKKNTSVVFF